jgi:hypothetical protein
MDPNIFGKITPPPAIEKFNNMTGSGSGIGLIPFVNSLIKIITVVAGLWGVFNIISAGYTYLQSNGNPKAAEEAGNKLIMSLVGLIIIVASFMITAIASYLLFGDATYILNPKITGVGP